MDSELLMKEISKIKNAPIIFILGCHRSGTTLLQSSLDAHPNIIAPPESQFINMLYSHFGKIKHWNSDNVIEFVNTLFEEGFFSNLWLLDKEQIIKKLESIVEYINYALLCKWIFYQMRKEKQEVLLLSDKNPIYCLFGERLLEIFPEARFIHIVRDPRDNVNSNIKRRNKKNTFFLARQWLGYNICIEKLKEKVPDKFFTIIYEEMVQNAENTFKPLCEFLKVPYNSSMLNHQFAASLPQYEDSKFYGRIIREHQNLLKPINTSNIGKWKTEMSGYDRTITEVITADFAKKHYGYDMEAGKINKSKISSVKLFKSRMQYIAWFLFTRFRNKNYTINKWYYSNKKKP